MKSGEVLDILQISRPTLTKYVREGLLKATLKNNGQYDYDEESVYLLLNKGVPRKTVIYARVSTSKQKQDLANQVNDLKSFCIANGWQIERIYEEVASGISFEKRKRFFDMLDLIMDKQVKRVVISYKDRLSRIGFELFKHLFAKFGTEIIVVSEEGSTKLDSEEVFEEIVSLLHCYSMKMYSKRKKKLVKELISDEE